MRVVFAALLVGVMCGGCQSILGIGDTALAVDAPATVMPDAVGTIMVDASPAMPDAPDTTPDATIGAPDAAVIIPDAAVIPDAAPVIPDAAPVIPDAAPVIPDGAGARPDAQLGTPDASTVSNFTLMAGTAWVVRGAAAPALLTVSIDRTGGFNDPVTVVVVGAPTGVTIQATTIQASSDGGVIGISASTAAALGATHLDVRAQSGSLVHDVSAAITIADPPGTIDTTFASNGVMRSCTSNCDLQLADTLLIQSDDSIVVGGGTGAGALVQRYVPAGTLDPSFGGGGTVNTSSLPIGIVYALAEVPAGGIVATGISTAPHGMMFRVTTGGVVDTSFGATPPVTVLASPGTGIAVQATGEIVFTETNANTTFGAVIKRIDGLGQLAESTFAGGTGGVGTGRFRGLALLADDSMEVAGSSSGQIVALHVDANGAGVASFGSAGVVTLTDTWVPSAFAAVPGPPGPLLIAGPAGIAGQFVLTELNGLGAVNTNFGTDGAVNGTVTGTGVNTVFGLAVQPDGRILVAATATGTSTSAILRYHPKGTLDTAFGASGEVAFPVSNTPLVAVAQQSDGRIIVLGSATDSGYVLTRIWP